MLGSAPNASTRPNVTGSGGGGVPSCGELQAANRSVRTVARIRALFMRGTVPFLPGSAKPVPDGS